MDAVLQMVNDFIWALNIFGLAIIIITKLMSNNKQAWFGVGCILLIIAVGNAWLLLSLGKDPSSQIAAVVGLLIHGGLGLKFIGDWLTAGAD